MGPGLRAQHLQCRRAPLLSLVLAVRLSLAAGPSASAGMACKTLALAGKQAFLELERLLGDPCPGTCQYMWALDPAQPGRYAEYGPATGHGCPFHWGHCHSLPAALITDPASLKVSCSPAHQVQSTAS